MYPVPTQEAERLSVLRSLNVLGTPSEAHVDAVCRTAQALFGVPIALVSLVEEDRQWFKARCGPAMDATSREVAFCTHAILSDDVLVVGDAREDQRFRANPLVVGEPGIRFYAGAPLLLQPGIRVGTLCVIDTVPRSFTAEQCRQLKDLAGIVVAHLRLSEAEARARAEAERRQQQEAALREANDLLRLAQEAAGAGTWDWDMRTGLIRLSPESARLHGLAQGGPVTLASSEWTALVHPDDTGPAWAEVQRAVETCSTSVIEFRAARPGGGAPTWVLGLGRVLLDGAGQPCRLVGLHLDITARKRAEAALVEARSAAERASEAKSDLLATLAHEIRTPLTGVLGYADLLLHAAPLDPEGRRYAEHIQRAGSALLRVVDSTLEFSAIESGQIALEPQPFSPAALVAEAAAVVEVTAAAKGLQLTVQVDPVLPGRLVGDPDRLRQVLLNLLTNAVKFTREGSVTLSVTCRDMAEGACRIRFEVTDTGIGIAQASRHRIFERYAQADGSVRRTYGGTGLGLAISKRLVEAMGGELGIEGEAGLGSSFWFVLSLPRADPIEAPASGDGGRGGRASAGEPVVLAEVA